MPAWHSRPHRSRKLCRRNSIGVQDLDAGFVLPQQHAWRHKPTTCRRLIARSFPHLQVPFGDSFFQDIQFLGTAAADSSSCHLRVTAQVKFLKRVLGVGGLIKSSATKVKISSW